MYLKLCYDHVVSDKTMPSDMTTLCFPPFKGIHCPYNKGFHVGHKALQYQVPADLPTALISLHHLLKPFALARVNLPFFRKYHVLSNICILEHSGEEGHA